MLWWSLSVFILCFTCWVYSSLDLGCRLGPGWASSHLLRTLLAFWRSCLWPFYREREWYSMPIQRTRQLHCHRRYSGRECSIAVPFILSVLLGFCCTFILPAMSRRLCIMSVQTLLYFCIPVLYFWSLCWDVVFRICIISFPCTLYSVGSIYIFRLHLVIYHVVFQFELDFCCISFYEIILCIAWLSPLNS